MNYQATRYSQSRAIVRPKAVHNASLRAMKQGRAEHCSTKPKNYFGRVFSIFKVKRKEDVSEHEHYLYPEGKSSRCHYHSGVADKLASMGCE